MDLTDVYRLFHPNTKEHTFFLAVHGTFSKTDQILGQKRLNKFRKIEIISCILSDQNGIKRDLKNNRSYRKLTNSWKLSSTVLDGNQDKRNQGGNLKIPTI